MGRTADSISFHQLADSHLAAGNYPEAEKAYKNALEVNPQDAVALAGLGVLAGASGRHDLAAQYLEKACSLEPANTVYLHNFGESLRQAGKLSQAETVLRKVIVSEPGFVPAYQSLRAVVQSAHAQALQRNDAGHAARLADELAALTNSHGNVLLESGSIPGAIELYRQVLNRQPGHAAALSNLGNALRIIGQISEAEIVCRKALSLSPDFAAAWNNLGNVLNEQGRFHESAECYQRALSIRPDFAEALHNCGSGSLFNMLYSQDVSSREIFERHRQWGRPFPFRNPYRADALRERGAVCMSLSCPRISACMRCCIFWNPFWRIGTTPVSKSSVMRRGRSRMHIRNG